MPPEAELEQDMEPAVSIPSTIMSMIGAGSQMVALGEDDSGGTMSSHLLTGDTTVVPYGATDETGGGGGAVNVEQKMFLVMSVALATVCFFTNAVQVGVFIWDGAILKNVKSLLLMSQALSGIFAAAVVAFPIQVISARGGASITEDSFDRCYLSHSGIILLTMLTSLSTATLLLLDFHLNKHYHSKYVASGSGLFGWCIIVAIVWIWAGVVALLPWLGWNTWLAHDAKCHLSTLWPLSFTAFVTFVTALHVALALLMWATGRAATLQAKHTHQRLQAQGQAPEEQPQPKSNSSEGCVRVAGWLISLSSVVPVLGHVVLASSCAASSQCMQSATHYHEDAASLPWASLLLTAAAVANPLLYVFSDDNVSASTVQLLARACCSGKWSSGGGSAGRGTLGGFSTTRATYHGGDGGSGVVTTSAGDCDITGAYVTNSDKQQLVGSGA